MAEGKRIVAQMDALLSTVRDKPRWHDTMAKVLTAIRLYLETHADAIREVDGRVIYSDGYRRFVVALTMPGRPAEEMSSAELAYATHVPRATIEDWLNSETTP